MDGNGLHPLQSTLSGTLTFPTTLDDPTTSALAAAMSASTSNAGSMPLNSELPIAFDQRLALLQELYQRKHAEIIAASQASSLASSSSLSGITTSSVTSPLINPDYIQSLINFTISQQAQQLALLQQQQPLHGHSSTDDVEMTSPTRSDAPGGVGDGPLANGSSYHHGSSRTPPAGVNGAVGPGPLNNNSAAMRNRRTFSGSGQTISQHTRDRLKNMIANKKQKQQRLGSQGSSGGGSTSNLSDLGGTSRYPEQSQPAQAVPIWPPPCAEPNLIQQLAAVASSSSAGISSAPHQPMALSLASRLPSTSFEPYPLPSSANANAGQISDYQLRKVNSEPNLKMRIRARLLNKGSSPTAAQCGGAGPSQGNSAVPNLPLGVPPPLMQHRALQRCDSDSVSSTLDPMMLRSPTSLVGAGSSLFDSSGVAVPAPLTQTTSMQLPPNFIIPSPSLPNLCNGLDQLQLDYASLMLQNAFTSFFSMPSLLKTPLLPTSMLDPVSTSSVGALDGLASSSEGGPSSSRQVTFDNRLNVPGSNHPSLLKQQLRDLVLRRKSLVREEPEDEQLVESISAKLRELSEAAGQRQQLKTGLAYDVAMSKHQCLCGENQNHVEHGGRVHSVWARLQERGLADTCERTATRKASLDLLKLVHSPTYVTFFAVSPTACLKMDPSELPLKRFVQLPCGGIGVDSDTYFNDANTQLAIRTAVGTLVELTCNVMDGKVRNGFACIRPPGHHAEREQAMGFCYCNNVSIAAKHLQQKYGPQCARIAIVDWDVHHGNGTQLCFEADSSVLYISLHRHDNGNFFPGTGAVTEMGKDSGKGYTVNVPFSGNIMGDVEYLAAWRVVVLPLLDAFRPDFILVSAGFDAVRGHSSALGGYNLTPQIFGYFTRTLLNFANGRIVLALEGGYDLEAICDSSEECVMALCGEGGELTRLPGETLDGVPNVEAQESIQKVITTHQGFWPCLTGLQGLNTSELHWQTISQRFSSLTVHS